MYLFMLNGLLGQSNTSHSQVASKPLLCCLETLQFDVRSTESGEMHPNPTDSSVPIDRRGSGLLF